MDQRSPRGSGTEHRWLRRRTARVRPYLFRTVRDSPAASPPPSLLQRVLDGLQALPGDGSAFASPPAEHRTPLVRLIDAQRARTVADRTPTAEIPVVTPVMAAQGVSWR